MSEIRKKDCFGALAAFVAILFLDIQFIQPAAAQLDPPPPYYAGYHYYSRKDIYYSHPGVYGEIYTINPYVPNITVNFLCEWVGSILSYSPKYRVQIGYIKGYKTTTLKYYREKLDANGHSKILPFPTGPSPSSWHAYAVRRPFDLIWDEPPSSDPTEWRLYIHHMINPVYTWHLNPRVPIDEQAHAESKHIAICIDGTHFRKLRVFDSAQFWYYWTRHVPVVHDPPYSLIEVFHHEFNANEGG